MRYDKYTIETTSSAEDVIISMLYDLGVEGAQIEDKVPLTGEELAGMFVDIMPPAGEDDGKAYISFYLDAELDHEELLADIRTNLDEMKSYLDIGSCAITCSTTADEDYLNNWKKYFHQFYVDDILFIPSWETAEEPKDAELVIHIDPGVAFGTGMHETTQLCIRALKKHVTKGCRVLDVGTGSGVLSVLSYKFGAGYAAGTDLDPCAISAVGDNMEANGLKDAGFKLVIGNLIDDPAVRDEVGDGYDIVVANILAEVLIPLLPSGIKCLKPGGIYIMSGIIDDKEDAVASACRENGLKVLDISHQGEWVGITAKKPEDA
ncbi:MAG: 50S ribosomal protein L11 methyltransferase [Lachnospiraceae bacterium]|nr:50S ribosomal protein L11 methyltransferase [Lachnospiraceae bacterium]